MEALSVVAILNMDIEEAKIKIVLDAVGPITPNDVNLAIASDAFILASMLGAGDCRYRFS